MAPSRIKLLEQQIAELKKQVEDANAAKQTVESQLQRAQETIEEQGTALAAVTERRHTAARGRASEGADADSGSSSDEDDDEPRNLIPRPKVPRGRRIRIHEGMGINKELYRAIQRTIRKLVVRAALNWEIDFRLQSPEKLAILYRAARKAYPVLREYEDNWPIAELAKQYMQNSRAYAREKGYLPKPGRNRKERSTSSSNSD